MTLEQAKEQYPELFKSFLEELPLTEEQAVQAVDMAAEHLDWDRAIDNDMTKHVI